MFSEKLSRLSLKGRKEPAKSRKSDQRSPLGVTYRKYGEKELLELVSEDNPFFEMKGPSLE